MLKQKPLSDLKCYILTKEKWETFDDDYKKLWFSIVEQIISDSNTIILKKLHKENLLFIAKELGINRKNKKGKRIGLWYFAYESFQDYYYYIDGVQYGPQMRYLNGVLSEVYMTEKGEKNGEFRIYYPNEEKKVIKIDGTYKNGKLEGSVQNYNYPEEWPISLVEYKKGVIDGWAEYWELIGQNNKTYTRYRYKNGEKNGDYKFHNDKTGQVTIGKYKNGKRDGKFITSVEGQEFISVYKNGKIVEGELITIKGSKVSEKVTYKEGKSGLYESYYSNGKVRERWKYKDGEIIESSVERFNKDGKKLKDKSKPKRFWMLKALVFFLSWQMMTGVALKAISGESNPGSRAVDQTWQMTQQVGSSIATQLPSAIEYAKVQGNVAFQAMAEKAGMVYEQGINYPSRLQKEGEAYIAKKLGETIRKYAPKDKKEAMTMVKSLVQNIENTLKKYGVMKTTNIQKLVEKMIETYGGDAESIFYEVIDKIAEAYVVQDYEDLMGNTKLYAEQFYDVNNWKFGKLAQIVPPMLEKKEEMFDNWDLSNLKVSKAMDKAVRLSLSLGISDNPELNEKLRDYDLSHDIMNDPDIMITPYVYYNNGDESFKTHLSYNPTPGYMTFSYTPSEAPKIPGTIWRIGTAYTGSKLFRIDSRNGNKITGYFVDKDWNPISDDSVILNADEITVYNAENYDDTNIEAIEIPIWQGPHMDKILETELDIINDIDRKFSRVIIERGFMTNAPSEFVTGAPFIPKGKVRVAFSIQIPLRDK